MNTEWLPTPPRNWKELQPHPLSALCEFGAGIDQAGLVEAMRATGYDADEPVVLFEGFILDGRHRLKAAIEAGVTPSFRKFVGKDPVGFVAKKMFRQHLTPSQLAMYAAKILNLKNGRPETAQICATNSASQAQAAKAVQVSSRSLSFANKVLANGLPVLQAAVKDGLIKVSTAARIAGKPAAEQLAAVSRARTRAAGGKVEREPGVEEDDPPVKDKLGNELPDLVARAFVDTNFKATEKALRGLLASVNELMVSAAGKRLRMHCKGNGTGKNFVPWYLYHFRRQLGDVKPYCICPTCQGGELGDKCGKCAGYGWITRIQHDEQTKEPLK